VHVLGSICKASRRHSCDTEMKEKIASATAIVATWPQSIGNQFLSAWLITHTHTRARTFFLSVCVSFSPSVQRCRDNLATRDSRSTQVVCISYEKKKKGEKKKKEGRKKERERKSDNTVACSYSIRRDRFNGDSRSVSATFHGAKENLRGDPKLSRIQETALLFLKRKYRS